MLLSPHIRQGTVTGEDDKAFFLFPAILQSSIRYCSVFSSHYFCRKGSRLMKTTMLIKPGIITNVFLDIFAIDLATGIPQLKSHKKLWNFQEFLKTLKNYEYQASNMYEAKFEHRHAYITFSCRNCHSFLFKNEVKRTVRRDLRGVENRLKRSVMIKCKTASLSYSIIKRHHQERSQKINLWKDCLQIPMHLADIEKTARRWTGSLGSWTMPSTTWMT
jgi:hypothetical protein